MSRNRIECHLSHGIDVVGESHNKTPQHWEGRDYYPRAAEIRTVVGRVSIMGAELPVQRQSFGGLIDAEGIAYDKHTIRVVSYETIAAASRQGLPIDRLAFPYGI